MSNNAHTHAQWFEDAGFGMFFHWNLTSLASADETTASYPIRIEDETDVPSDYLRQEDYSTLAEEFDPVEYDPDDWVATAKAAGAEYAVLTTKHHLGFCLWPSEYGDFSVKQYLDGRDLVQEFVEACRRHGLRIGLYYSLPDWSHPDFVKRDPKKIETVHEDSGTGDIAPQYGAGHDSGHVLDHINSEEGPKLKDTEELRQFERYYKFIKGQIRELVTWYGDIDLLWFDSPVWKESVDWRMGDIYTMVRAEQPEMLVNGRGGYSQFADFWDSENTIPEIPEKKWGENAQQWKVGASQEPDSPHWFYEEDMEYRGVEWTLGRLARTVGIGGNLLLNVGPKPNGEFPEQARERMPDLADWMAHSKQSITGVDPGPWPPKSSVPITRRNGVWYVHVLEDAAPKVEVTGVPEPTDVRLLRTHEEVSYSHADGELTLDVPEERRETADEVVAITWPRSQQHLL